MKEQICQWISQNDTEKAFNALLEHATGQDRNDLLLLNATYEKLKRENRLFLASRGELSLDYNRLNDSLLEMVDRLMGNTEDANVPWSASPSNEQKQRPWQFGLVGLLVLAVIAFGASRWLDSPNPASNTVTVLVHGTKGKDDLVLPNRGIVKLVYGDAIVSKQINRDGEATFQQIGDVFFDPAHGVEIWFEDPEGEHYRAVAPDSQYHLTRGKYVGLEVELLGMDQIHGVVKDFVSGDTIVDAIIRVNGEETRSEAYGEFQLDIPKAKQKPFVTIRAYKAGYENWEQQQVPTTTDQEITILLKKNTPQKH